METVYLRDGEKVKLHKKVDDQTYIVERYMLYVCESGADFPELTGKLEVVDCVYKEPPISVKEAQVEGLTKQIAELREILRDEKEKLRKIKMEYHASQDILTDYKNR